MPSLFYSTSPSSERALMAMPRPIAASFFFGQTPSSCPSTPRFPWLFSGLNLASFPRSRLLHSQPPRLSLCLLFFYKSVPDPRFIILIVNVVAL